MNPDRELNEVLEASKTKPAVKEAEVALWETRFLTSVRKVFKEANFQQLSHESMITVLQVCCAWEYLLAEEIFDGSFYSSPTVPWNKGRVEKNPTQYWTLFGVSKIYKHCIKL